MNQADDFTLRLSVFQMLKAADVMLADLQARLERADNRYEADLLRTSIKRVRSARQAVQMMVA